jgi:hypothetical protein
VWKERLGGRGVGTGKTPEVTVEAGVRDRLAQGGGELLGRIVEAAG